MKNNCIYFVEGKCEATLLAALKESPQKIIAGKVKVFNVITGLIPRSQLVTIQAGTTVVFVFDTDVPVTDSLKKNIELVNTYCSKTKVIFLPQVMNLEDELVRCTDIGSISELTRSKSTKDFKRDFCAMTNCRDVLNRHQLDVLRLWTQKPPEVFAFIPSNLIPRCMHRTADIPLRKMTDISVYLAAMPLMVTERNCLCKSAVQ